MTAPKPAAVRAAMKNLNDDMTPDELAAWGEDPRWRVGEILADHIRAVAAEMRAEAKRNAHYDCTESADTLNSFADRLEGREP